MVLTIKNRLGGKETDTLKNYKLINPLYS